MIRDAGFKRFPRKMKKRIKKEYFVKIRIKIPIVGYSPGEILFAKPYYSVYDGELLGYNAFVPYYWRSHRYDPTLFFPLDDVTLLKS